MRAVWLHTFGPPDVLVPGEASDPIPGPNEVLVRVEVAGVQFFDLERRSGEVPAVAGRVPPLILGSEIGGTVEDAGADVDRAVIGTRVVAGTGGFGGYATRAVVEAAKLIPVPEGLALESAVALLSHGETAMGVMQAAPVGEGKWVLIEAAAGGVGTLLVQLAVAAGALVVGAASGAEKLELVRSLGAHVAVDYAASDWIDEVRESTNGKGVDVVYDSVGGAVGGGALGLLAAGGRFIVFGHSSGSYTKLSSEELKRNGTTVIGYGPGTAPSREGARQLITNAIVDASLQRLRPIIGQTFPLEEAGHAHSAIQARSTTGKTLLVC